MSGDAVRELLPLFPLSQVVLFPSTRVPLHIFEPRYRQMLADALQGSRRIGMVAVPPQHVDSMAGDPPVYPVGCAGTISRAQRLPDGRYQVVLEGAERFRIHEEPPRSNERLYRVAKVELLEEAPGEPERLGALREQAIGLMTELIRKLPSAARKDAERVRSHLAGLEDRGFTDGLCQALSFSSTEKQGLLEADRLSDRLEQLAGLLRFRLAEVAASVAAGSETFH